MTEKDVSIFHTGPLGVNTYLCVNGNSAFIVDPGGNGDMLLSQLNERNLRLDAILLTHNHFDHVGAVSQLAAATGARVWLDGNDIDILTSESFVSLGQKVVPFKANALPLDTDIIEVADVQVGFIRTPGHTPGSVVYTVDNLMFSGDTLFQGSYGRVDFPHSSVSSMRNSLKTLLTCSRDFTVLPGHGERTTIFEERENYAL